MTCYESIFEVANQLAKWAVYQDIMHSAYRISNLL